MTDFETWLSDNQDRVFRYWVYKRMFTPEEQASQYIDQSIYEDPECEHGRIAEAVELPDGDILLGFCGVDMPEDSSAFGYIDYHKLSEISLAYAPRDNVGDEDIAG